MFTLEAIASAHSKVKSGADFPAYIRDLKQIGVLHYETYVQDGHTNYYGTNGFQISAPPKYADLRVTEICDAETFKADLKSHQQGQTDYPTFCNDCAKSGIEKWIVDLQKMTCNYFDKAGNEVLVEGVPE